MNISFQKANPSHVDIILSWLAEPHMIEFWDNSSDHKEDILNFIYGRKQQYFFGTAMYWIGSMGDEPYAFIVTDVLDIDQNLTEIQIKFLSWDGNTINLDFCIGNKKFLGQGLAAPTLKQFCHFYKKQQDSTADTFFIDPGANNPRAKHVYAKSGFIEVGMFEHEKEAFVGERSYLMVKKV